MRAACAGWGAHSAWDFENCGRDRRVGRLQIDEADVALRASTAENALLDAAPI
jgi:hypothetical protein